MVQRFVAVGAQGDEVQFVVVALLAPQFFVVDMEISSRPTELASPTIAAENLLSELIVRFGIKSQARPLRSNAVHEAFSVTSSRNACRCSPGRNLKNRDMDCRSFVGGPRCRGSLLPGSLRRSSPGSSLGTCPFPALTCCLNRLLHHRN